MNQRHDGGYGEEHDGRTHEQYGGRMRESRDEFGSHPDDWERPRRSFSGRSGYEEEDFPRFGGRRWRRDLEREDSERGAFAGRGYDEPSFRRSFGERGGPYGSRAGSGRWEDSEFARRGEARGEPEWGGFGGGYGESERGRLVRSPGGERYRERSFGGYGGSTGFGGYGDAWGGYEGGREYGAGYGRGELGRERRGSQERRAPGRFSGRGPKGYQRSDERIREELCDLLTASPDIDASDLTVVVKNCEVTLEGSVDDRWTKRHAEDVAEGVSGVRQVHNRLQVQAAGQQGRPGEESGSGRFGNGGRSSGTGQS
jgi:hypothetical protein